MAKKVGGAAQAQYGDVKEDIKKDIKDSDKDDRHQHG
jgi:uncharacterized protein YjbJ (UPF0337 family)